MTREEAGAALELSLMRLGRAKDSRGRYIVLYRGDNKAASLRATTQKHAEVYRQGVEFVSGFNLEPDPLAQPGEVTYLRNLSLLANATAAAIEYEGCK